MNQYRFQKPFFTIFCCFLVSFPVLTVGECTCDLEEEDGNNKSESLRYRIAAFAAILLAGALGVCIPVLGKSFRVLSPENDSFFVVKAFAAGVILSTGFIHVLPDAFESLTSPCLKEHPWGDFPFTGFIAMMAAIGTLSIDSFATSYYKTLNKSQLEPCGGDRNGEEVGVVGPVDGKMHTHGSSGGHSHGSLMTIDSGETLIRHRVISQVLEVGIVAHSVIIGISLGASQNPNTIKPLVIALTFHQFFEGIGLGGCITQAAFKKRVVTIMAVFFSLTTPIGILIGIGISNVYKENSPTALIVQGVFDSASAGILIYMSLVDLLATDFMNPKMQANGKLLILSHVGLLFGAGCMSLLAKWA